jgi:putative DNA primase/helicase
MTETTIPQPPPLGNAPLSRIGRAALRYATTYGWRVFPVASRSKIPLIKAWPQEATTDPDRVRKWWTQRPAANLGLACGTGSGIVVVDLDIKSGGLEAWAELLDINGAVDTLEARTGTGGGHLYFKAPSVALKNSAGAIKRGIDTRADGGYVVAPPSRHPNGQLYEWVRGVPPVDLPAWLLSLCPRRSGPPTASLTVPGSAGPIVAGARNVTLTSLAGTMRRRGMVQAAILAALMAENTARCQPPLPEAIVRQIAGSVARYAPASVTPGHFRGVRPLPMGGHHDDAV